MARTSTSHDALELLHRDHEHVLELIRRCELQDAEDEQHRLAEQIVDELQRHTLIEEQVFYPWLREATAREDLFQEASIEHATTKELLGQLPGEPAGTPRFKALVRVLGEYVEHHVKEEEGEIFPQVRRTGVDLDALGAALEDCKAGRSPLGPQAAGDDARADRAPARRDASRHDGSADDERFLAEHGDELSRSTQRAKWIHAADDRPDHDGQTLATRSLDVIRAWAEARGGRPATTPGAEAERPRVLRIDFPDYDERLQPVSWEAWGRTFAERDLVFLFQETMKAGNQSNFFRLDSPHREDG